MSLFDFLKKQHSSQEVPKPQEAAAATPPAERKSLLEIAREAQAREQAAAVPTIEENQLEPAEAPQPMDFYSVRLTKGTPDLLDSKLGGVPYWNDALDYPCDEDGMPMRLLLQLNFERLALGDDRLPLQGMLQFFIGQSPLCTGKVVYHSTIREAAKTDEFPFMPSDKGFSPVKAEAFVSLQREQTETTADGHKLFGTPAFCQADPREALPLEEMDYYDTLLLQLDSDFNGGDPLIIWGDSGVGNFFINAETMQNNDFNKVLFYWDCY